MSSTVDIATMKNPSFVLHGTENVSFEDLPIPELSSEYDVIVEIKKTGICGSDVHFYAHGGIGPLIVKEPMVLGHESSGVVSQVGSKVKNVKPGDRVAVEPGPSCGTCIECKTGHYNLCPEMAFAATPPNNGTLSRLFRVPGSLVYPLPNHISFEEGAAIEPLAVAVHAVSSLGNFAPNGSIAVFGCGPVGLLCLAVAKALGASRLIVVDVQQSRLDFAKTYLGGAGVTVDTYVPVPQQEGETKVAYSMRNGQTMRDVLGLSDSAGVDLVVDASGAEVCIQTGLYVAKRRGTVVQLGIGEFFVTLDLMMVMLKELVFRGSFRYGPGDYPLAIALVSQGKVDVKPLITHRYTFTSSLEAFKAVQSGNKGLIKAVISGPGVEVDES